MIASLGEDPAEYDAANLRAFILEQAKHSGPGAMKTLISAVQAFLRYLSAIEKYRAGLDRAVPSIAGWQLASQPRSLDMDDVERILKACDPETAAARCFFL